MTPPPPCLPAFRPASTLCSRASRPSSRATVSRPMCVLFWRTRVRVAGSAPIDTAPGPRWLLAELSYRCPLRCVYCSNPVEHASLDAELTTDAWRRVLTEARALGAVQLGFSGGEPLVRPDLED